MLLTFGFFFSKLKIEINMNLLIELLTIYGLVNVDIVTFKWFWFFLYIKNFEY